MNLSEYIKKQGYTYNSFGELIGVTGTSVYRYSVGLRFPERPVVDRIKKVTNGKFGYDYFASLTQEPKSPTRRK